VRRSSGQRLILATGIVLVACLFLGAGAVWFVTSKLNNFDRIDVAVDAAVKGGPENYLLVGSDSRDGISEDDPDAGGFLDGGYGGGRSDTIMVARVDPAAEKIAVLSIPRDLYVTIAGGDHKDRINTAYAESPQTLVDTVSQTLGIPLNHYVEIDFRGFQSVVDVLGGVPMYFDQPMRDEWTGLDVSEPGCVVLKGPQALAFSRARHVEVYDGSEWVSDPTADLGRITRQQLFMRRALDKARSLGLTDVLKINRLMDVATDSISFDPGLSITSSIGLIRHFAGSGGDPMVGYSLPTEPFSTEDGSSVLELDVAAAQPTLDIFRGLAPMPGTAVTGPGSDGGLAPATVQVTVLNGTGIDGQAGVAADGLRGFGFTVGSVGDAGTAAQIHTALRYAPGQRAAADLVAGSLRGAAELVEDQGTSGGVVLVTGADFAGVYQPPAEEIATSTDAGADAEATTTTTSPPPDEVTSTSHLGFAPGDPPAGVTCG